MSNPWDAFGDDESAAQRLAEWLVVQSVGDLEYRSRADSTSYERLGISAILRRLLLDRHPVLHRARARLSLSEPTFHFSPMKQPIETHPTLRIAVSFGDLTMEPSTASGGVEDFLAAPAAFHFGNPISVKDVIRSFAHTYGGVHLGAPESSFERIVQRAGPVLPLAAHRWSQVLSDLAQITLEAVSPIAAQLAADPYPLPRMTEI